jgi:hypothetical protein
VDNFIFYHHGNASVAGDGLRRGRQSWRHDLQARDKNRCADIDREGWPSHHQGRVVLYCVLSHQTDKATELLYLSKVYDETNLCMYNLMC